MIRRQALVLMLFVLAGCRGPSSALDPLMGKQTVSAPRTGLASKSPPPSSYYEGGRNAAASASAASSPYVPPGGQYGYQDDFVNRSLNKAPENSAGRATAPPANNGGTTSRGAPPRVNGASVPIQSTSPFDRPPASTGGSVKPPSRSTYQASNSVPGRSILTQSENAAGQSAKPTNRLASTPRQPRMVPVGSSRVTEIAELPDVTEDDDQPSASSGGFRPVGSVRQTNYADDGGSIHRAQASRSSAPTSRNASLQRSSTAARPAEQYDFDPDYRWLSGRLEYSRVTKQWKLRYIPIDGETDEFGGSVVLDGGQLLDGVQSGDFVTVHGGLGENASNNRGFAPIYHVDRVE